MMWFTLSDAPHWPESILTLALVIASMNSYISASWSVSSSTCFTRVLNRVSPSSLIDWTYSSFFTPNFLLGLFAILSNDASSSKRTSFIKAVTSFMTAVS